MRLKFLVLSEEFAICKLAASAALPDWCDAPPFFTITRTPEELSIVCPTEAVPGEVKAERGWACLQLRGPFAFQQTGVLASFIAPLADERIPILAVSTYDTDYVLVKRNDLTRTLAALKSAGHELQSI